MTIENDKKAGPLELRKLIEMAGEEVSLCDWQYGPMYSALVLSAAGTGDCWGLFGYGVSQPMPEEWRQVATPAHTNAPRSGESGLPQGWAGLVTGWSMVSTSDSDAFLEWTQSAHAEYVYNGKTYWESPLGHLFGGADRGLSFGVRGAGGEMITDPDELVRQFNADRDNGWLNPMPVHMRENLSYRVSIRADGDATLRLRAYLRQRGDQAGAVREARIRLEAMRASAGLSTQGAELSRVIALLTQPSEAIVIWGRLHGLWKRTIC